MKQAYYSTFLVTMALILPFGLSSADDLSSKSKDGKEQNMETWTEPLTGMKFVRIEGGCFQMGQLPFETRLLNREVGKYEYKKYYGDELPRHKVCLDGFWMGATEVTQKEWVKVMRFNPSHFNTDENFPVDSVSWQDAANFIEKLNKENHSDQFQLPSEAQWEFAARGNTEDVMYHTGNTITSGQANFNGSIPFALNLRDEYKKSPVQTASFSPNSYGLYDMHGNVWEWCKDWYGEDYYEDSPLKNPPGPDGGEMRVLRGGSWFRYSGHIRSATRYKNKPTGQYADTGFRLVKSAKTVPGELPTDSFIFSPDF
jgi:formylglycine-generating enzyme required for sulfatase activity